MTIQFSWGWRIGALYVSFVAMILVLVVSSSRQKSDLVSPDYYKEEIAYQHVVDASRNQAGLSGALIIHGDSKVVAVDFPGEFFGKNIQGTVQFYSAADKELDRNFAIHLVNNRMEINRDSLQKTNYSIKVSYSVDGKNYYQENQLNLSK